MSSVQLSEGGFQVVYPPRLVVPVFQSCQSPTRIWLVNYLHLHLHLQTTAKGHNSQAKHQAPSKGQPKNHMIPTGTAAMPPYGVAVHRESDRFGGAQEGIT